VDSLLERPGLTHDNVLFEVLLAANQMGDLRINLGSHGSALEFNPMLDLLIRSNFAEVASYGYRAFLECLVLCHFAQVPSRSNLSVLSSPMVKIPGPQGL